MSDVLEAVEPIELVEPIAGAPGAMLVIISGPSGVGKDTIIDALRLRSHDPEYHYVVTCTTRARRPGEIDDVDYHFLTRKTFAEMRAAGGFLEANEVHGNWYGTPRSQVNEALVAGRDVILKIDVQGAQVVKGKVPGALLIFLIPPSLEDLFQRLRSRATETADELEVRQRNAAIELARQEDYDYVVTNETGQVERTAERIDDIIATEHARHPDRQVVVYPAVALTRGEVLEAWPDAEVAAGGGPRAVEVAVDAAGRGGDRTYTYLVPEALADLVPGEAVLVGFGKRQALGIVVAEAGSVAGGLDLKPILERVRADGPLLPPLTLALARSIAASYLAPPALVLRAMLPPGLLERLELVAEVSPAAGRVTTASVADPVALDLLAQLERGPRPVRDLAGPDGRAGLLRRLRSLEADGRVTLEWTLLGAGAGPRYERWIAITEAGRAVAAGTAPAGRPLGPRQADALAELAASPDGQATGADLSGRHGSGAVAGMVRRGLAEAEVRERPRRPLAARPAGRRGGRPPATDLLPAQAEAVARTVAAIAARDPRPLLLDGVTGGGKTTIYVEAIAATLEAGRPALVLVPEIALALPLVDRLRADLDARVALVHSGLGEGERADEWRRIRSGEADIVVGTRLAVLAPLADVGLIVVDEEHDAAYKSDRTPRLQARDVAVRLARHAGAAVVLGSATPAVESVGLARSGTYDRIVLPARPVGTAPEVEIVDMRAELADGQRGVLSRSLAAALTALDTAAGDQAILVLNRRGTASVVLCRDCGHVQACPDCERPLVYHQAGTTLRCHHCGRATPLASRCPACASPRIRYLGGGTERVEREVRDTFPGLRVGRLDRDVVQLRGAAERVIDAFSDGRLDVLVGTSLVAKGLDIPSVTLVGVVSSDVALNLPDERAAERTYQLLVQAIGRAGRGDRPGRAILQTYQPDHPAITAAASGDRTAFYDAELALRERFGSPPFGRLVKLTVGLADPGAAQREAEAMAGRLRDRATERGVAVAVVGPAPAYIARRADRWRWNVVLRGDDPVGLLDGGVDAPWSVDVDPESLL